MNAEWWMLLVTLSSVAVSFWAVLQTRAATKRATDQVAEANAEMRMANTISRQEQAHARLAHRELASSAEASAEAAKRSAVAAEATDRRQAVAEERSLEVHDVQWNASWDTSPPLDIHPHTADRRMRIFQYGPDDAFKVQVLFYVGAFCWFTHEVDEVKRDGHFTLIPVDRKKLIAELNERGVYRDNRRIHVDPYSDAGLDHLMGHTQRAYHFPIRLIFRWESAAGVRYDQTLLLPPLVEITNGKVDYNPPRENIAVE